MKQEDWLPAGILVVALSGCGTIIAPSQPLETLAINPEVPTLRVGETQRLVAILKSGTTERAVSAAWNTTDPTVIAIDDLGSVSAKSRGAAAVTARFAEHAATKLMAVVADLSGQWSGQFVVKQCRQISGAPPSPCRFVLNGVHPFVLTIAQIHGDVTAYLNLSEPGSTIGGPVAGTVGPDATPALPEQDLVDSEVHATLTDWRSAVDFDSDTMDGTFNLKADNPSIFGAQVLVYGMEFHAIRGR